MAQSTRQRKSLESRFWSKVKTEGACWLWTGALAGSLGYGQFRVDNDHTDFAHRVSWRLANGPIPDGLLVLHRCDVPRCVRPQHLYLGTHADNAADMAASLSVRRAYRPRVGGELLSVRMSAALLAKMDEIAVKQHLSRSDVIRLSVENFYARLFNKKAA